MPFTLRNLEADLEDVGSEFDGPPGLGEARREDVDGRRDSCADQH